MAVRRITLIQGHPDPKAVHYCHALAEAYAIAACPEGHELRRVEVARLDFPLLRAKSDWDAPLPATLTTAATPLARFACPPLTAASVPLAVFAFPLPTQDSLPLAVPLYPPLIEEPKPLAVLLDPAVIEANAPLISF